MARPLSVREKRGRVLMGGSGEGQGVACVGGQPLPFIYPIAGCPLPQPPLLPKLEASLRFSHTHQSKDNSRCFLDYAYIFLNMQAEGSENCYILFNGFLRPPTGLPHTHCLRVGRLQGLGQTLGWAQQGSKVRERRQVWLVEVGGVGLVPLGPEKTHI